MFGMSKFDSIEALIKTYKKFEKKTLKDIYDYVSITYPNIKLTTNKGIVGQILEALIGNAPNSNPLQDVHELDIELKVLPLRKIGDKLQPKERSKIKSINYQKIVKEEWNSSDLRDKMKKILFLQYEHPTGKTFEDWEEFIFNGCLLYDIENENESIIQIDWEEIKNKVVFEQADTLSESQGKVLGACTSGTGKLITYGSNKQAKQRSYSLKHNYLKVFYDEKVNKQKFENITEDTNVSVVELIINKINELNGKNLELISRETGIEFSNSSKSSFRFLVNKIFGLKEKSQIRELEENGIQIKTIPVNTKNKVWEAMSFPKFSLIDLLSEEWEVNDDDTEEAIFKKIISNGFIFIPIIKEKEKSESGKPKFKSWKTWKVGKSFYWKADDKEIQIIQNEWNEAKKIVQNGVKVKDVKHGDGYRQENNLLKSTKTKMIHIRPHGKDSKDIDKPYFKHKSIKITWQSFWLNKSYINQILKRNS
jgi:DNA mismatch repair endonuclease MutH